MNMRSQPPPGITLIAMFHAAVGITWLLVLLYAAMALNDLSRLPFIGDGAAEITKYAVPFLLLILGTTVAYGVTAWAMMSLKPWAPQAVMATAFVGALPLLFPVLVGGGTSLTVALAALIIIDGIVIWYVIRPDIRAVFEGLDSESGGDNEVTCPNSKCGFSGIDARMQSCPMCGSALGSDGGPALFDPPSNGGGGGNNVTVGRDGEGGVGGTSIGGNRRRNGRPTRGLEVAGAKLQAWLVVVTGPDARNGTAMFPLGTEDEIGRGAGCSIRLNDDFVGGHHARIKLQAGQFFLYDQGSRNGTYVNDQPVQKLMLYDGAYIRLGQTVLEFKRAGSSR